MKFGKDGGPKSRVWGYWLCEFKRLFSVVLLRFETGSREAYHNHAFGALSWVVSGALVEEILGPGRSPRRYTPSLRPIITRRETFHRVRSEGRSWVFSIRGPWSKTWQEYDVATGRFSTLSKGRVEV